jgi:flagellar protein FlbD
MITVTRLDGAEMLVNVDLIESVEPTPDTLLCLSTGTKLMVLETLTQIVDRVIAFKHAVHCGIRVDATERTEGQP